MKMPDKPLITILYFYFLRKLKKKIKNKEIFYGINASMCLKIKK